MKIHVHIETYTQIFTAAFLVLVKKGKQPKHPSTDEQINKLVCPYHGIRLSNKKEQNLDTCNNLDESPDNYSKWGKKISKGHVLQ